MTAGKKDELQFNLRFKIEHHQFFLPTKSINQGKWL